MKGLLFLQDNIRAEYKLRKALHSDLGKIWEIMLQAKEMMRREGRRQWTEEYPLPVDMEYDIDKGDGYVLYIDRESFKDEVMAYGAVVFDGEPNYAMIKGKWLTNGNYVVLHRLAVSDKYKNMGVATIFMQRVEELARTEGVTAFRVDTNFDNVAMRRIFIKGNFTQCGEITVKDGTPRIAYEKCL